MCSKFKLSIVIFLMLICNNIVAAPNSQKSQTFEVSLRIVEQCVISNNIKTSIKKSNNDNISVNCNNLNAYKIDYHNEKSTTINLENNKNEMTKIITVYF